MICKLCNVGVKNEALFKHLSNTSHKLVKKKKVVAKNIIDAIESLSTSFCALPDAETYEEIDGLKKIAGFNCSAVNCFYVSADKSNLRAHFKDKHPDEIVHAVDYPFFQHLFPRSVGLKNCYTKNFTTVNRHQ